MNVAFCGRRSRPNRPFAFHAQTFWKEQQSAAARHGGESLSPHLVIDQDSDVVAIRRITAEKGNHRVGVTLQFFQRQRRHRIVFGYVFTDALQNMVPLDRRLRDVPFRRTKPLCRERSR